MRKKRDRKRERRLKKGNKNYPYREVLCLRRLPLSGAQHLKVRRLQKRVEVRQEPLLALVQSFLRGSGLVEPRGQRLAGAREAEELKVALDPGPDRGEVMRGRGLDGGGHAVEEVRGLWGGADGGWWWWCGGWKDRFEKVGGERSRKKKVRGREVEGDVSFPACANQSTSARRRSGRKKRSEMYPFVGQRKFLSRDKPATGLKRRDTTANDGENKAGAKGRRKKKKQ